MSETQAQYTERMREKYREALERLESIGPTELEKIFDKILCKKIELDNKKEYKLEKLSDILKRY